MTSEAAPRTRIWRRAAALAGLALAIVAAARFGFDPHPLDGAFAGARDFAHSHTMAAAAGYFALYTLFAAFCLPGAWMFSVAGGATFGFGGGLALALAANAAGATLAMAAARRWLRQAARARYPDLLQRAQAAAKRDGLRFVIAARLTPVVPFFLVNLAAGLAGMRPSAFALASLIGATPLVALSAWAGASWAAGAEVGAPLNPVASAALAIVAVALLVVPPLARRFRPRRP